jgi:hypothetical protein
VTLAAIKINNKTMNAKITVILMLTAAMSFAGLAAATGTVSSKFSTPPREDVSDIMHPFIVTAPRITPVDIQLEVTGQGDLGVFRNSTDQVLANRFQAEFKANGFKGNVDFLSTSDTPIPTLPLLKVALEDWRVIPGEKPECLFSATLVTRAGTTLLGDYEGVAEPSSGASTARGQARSLRDAATRAVDEVYQTIQAKHMLSGAAQ